VVEIALAASIPLILLGSSLTLRVISETSGWPRDAVPFEWSHCPKSPWSSSEGNWSIVTSGVEGTNWQKWQMEVITLIVQRKANGRR